MCTKHCIGAVYMVLYLTDSTHNDAHNMRAKVTIFF